MQYRSLERIFISLHDILLPRAVLRWNFYGLLLLFLIFRIVKQNCLLVGYGLGFYQVQVLARFLTPRGLSLAQEQSQNEDEELQLQADFKQETGAKLVPGISQMQLWTRSLLALLIALFLSGLDLLQVDIFWPIVTIYSVLSVGWVVHRLVNRLKSKGISLWQVNEKVGNM